MDFDFTAPKGLKITASDNNKKNLNRGARKGRSESGGKMTGILFNFHIVHFGEKKRLSRAQFL